MKNRKQGRKTPEVFAGRILQKYLSLIIFVFLLLGASSVSAEEKSADQWQYDFQVYMWGATFKNNLVNGDSVTITFSDMIKNLKLAGMVTFGARNDKFSMMTDVIHLRLEMQIKKR